MCLQSMPSIQSLTISVYLFVREYDDSGYFLLKQAVDFKNKKQNLYLSQILKLVFLELIISGNDAGGQGRMRWEFTTAVPVYSPSMSITQYGCHPVVGLCNYFAK